MGEITIKKVEDIGYYQGPKAITGIKFHHAAKDLGITAWGMNVLEMDPGCANYPEHDHTGDGQEEVYVVLKGSGTLLSGGEQWPVQAGTLVRFPVSSFHAA